MSGRAASTVEAPIANSAALRQKLALVTGNSTERFWTRPDLREIFPEFFFLPTASSAPVSRSWRRPARVSLERAAESEM